MIKEKKKALKILKCRNDNIFTKLKIVKFKIDTMDNWGEIEKGGNFGHTYKVNYAKGLNWINPLTYLVGISTILIITLCAIVEIISEVIEECRNHLYSETVDIIDVEQTKFKLD